MPEPIRCRYCQVEWDFRERRFAHLEDCYIVTGVYPVRGGKKRAPQEPVEPLAPSWLDDPEPPKAA